MMLRLIFWIALAALPVCAGLVTNPGFETGDFTGWGQVPAATGSKFDVDGSNPHSGMYEAEFGGGTGDFDNIFQNFPTTPGQFYVISYWLNGNSNGEFLAAWNATIIQDLVGSNGAYTNYTFTVPASSHTITTLEFAGYNPPAWEYLDDVSVTLVAPSPTVPEPGTFALAGVALVALGVARRMKRSRSKATFPSSGSGQ